MSNATNEKILENVHDQFTEALAKKDYTEAEALIGKLKDEGFTAHASDMHFDLLAAKEQETI